MAGRKRRNSLCACPSWGADCWREATKPTLLARVMLTSDLPKGMSLLVSKTTASLVPSEDAGLLNEWWLSVP
jgi:hypothetical protein